MNQAGCESHAGTCGQMESTHPVQRHSVAHSFSDAMLANKMRMPETCCGSGQFVTSVYLHYHFMYTTCRSLFLALHTY